MYTSKKHELLRIRSGCGVFYQIGWSAGTAVWSYGLLHRKAVFLCTNTLSKSFRHKTTNSIDVVFSKEESSVKTFFPVTYYGRNRWNSIFAQLLWTMNIFSVNAEGVRRCNKTVWRPKYKIWFNLQHKYNHLLSCWFHHDSLTHTRPPACKNLVLDLCCYICSGIIISIQLRALIQSHLNQSAHVLWCQRFHWP